VGALGDQKGTAYAITISWNTSSDSLSVDFPSFCPIGRLQRAFTMRLSERRKVCLWCRSLAALSRLAKTGPAVLFLPGGTIQPTSLMNSTRVRGLCVTNVEVPSL
jgi:hypothetical protein